MRKRKYNEKEIVSNFLGSRRHSRRRNNIRKRMMINYKVNNAVLSAFKDITYEVDSDTLRIKSVSAVLSSFITFLENLVC